MPPASLQKVTQRLTQMLRLMVGVGDYAAYVQHMHTHHADAPLLTRAQWYNARVDARYGVGDGTVKRCPC